MKRRFRAPASPSATRLAAALAGAVVTLALSACASPPPNPDRAEANSERQQALEQMERAGQRNDDRPVMQ